MVSPGVIVMQDQKVAMVTGGTRGIGRAITLALCQSGVHVAAGYLSNADAAEETREAALGAGGSISLHQVDIGDPNACASYANDVIEAHGRIDFLVNNAGINIDRTVRRMTVDEWHQVMRINI